MSRPVEPLANLDLNLLVTLRELIRARNVTRAAERIGITQPAASAALARLRRHFDDELLVRGKGGYLLTPLASRLAEQVETVCAAVDRIFTATTTFEPSTSDREFSLLMADYTVEVLGRRISRALGAAAPHARLHIRLVKGSLAADVADTIRFIDGMIAPPIGRSWGGGFNSADLFTDRWVCLVSRDNTEVGDELSMNDLARLDWVVPYHDAQGYPPSAPIPRQLGLLGIRPHVAVRVESYQAAPHFVAGTNRIALIQQRLAERFAEPLGLRVLDCPGRPEPVREELWWHESHDDDPGHAWFRRLVVDAAKEL
jgi:DNA-binding transcriptional LysR family regulator